MFIAEAPGETEDDRKIPLCGTSGQKFNRMLFASGYIKPPPNRMRFEKFLEYLLHERSRSVYCTNILKCRPPDNRQPKPDEIASCLGNLVEEYNNVQPNIVITLGDTATRVFLNVQPVSRYRGYTYWSDTWNVKVLPTFHPAFTLPNRNPLYTDVVIQDLLKARKQSRFREYRPPRTHYDYDPDTTQYEFLHETPFDFDLEATGLDHRHDHILGCAISWKPGHAIHLELSQGEQSPHWTFFKTLMESPVHKHGQNMPYDVLMCKAANIEPKNIMGDTMLGQSLLCPDLPCGLSFIASLHTDYPFYKETEAGVTKASQITTLTPEERAEYACLDADVTGISRPKIERDLRDEGMFDVYNKHVIPMINVVTDLQLHGIRVDLIRMGAIQNEVEKTLRNSNGIIQAFGARDFNDRTNLKIILYEMLKLPVVKRTKTGPSTDKESIMRLTRIAKTQDQQIVLAAIAEGRRYQKLHDSWGENFKRYLYKSYVNPQYRLNKDAEDDSGTRTGRLSSEDPNIQQQPPFMRDIYIPDNDSFEWVRFDAEKLELKVVSVIANDSELWEWAVSGNPWEEMRHALFSSYDITSDSRTSGDLHSIYGQRDACKRVVYGILYGRAAKSIAMYYGMAIPEVTRIMDYVLGRFTRLRKWREDTLHLANTKREVQTPFGRKRLFPHGAYGPALNMPVQSTAADVGYRGILNVYSHYPGKRGQTRIICLVHDEINMQIPKENPEIIRHVKSLLEEPIPELRDNVFTYEVKKGPNWKDLQEVTLN